MKIINLENENFLVDAIGKIHIKYREHRGTDKASRYNKLAIHAVRLLNNLNERRLNHGDNRTHRRSTNR